MKILHVGHITNRLNSGVSVVVPKYLEYQARYADVSLLNLTDYAPANSIELYDVHLHSNQVDGLALNGVDLVVFHEVYRYPFIKIYKKLLKKGIPYIIVPHGSITKGAQSQSALKKKIGNAFFFKRFIKNAAAIQYLSEKEREQSVFSDKNSIVQGSGIELIGRKKKSYSAKGLSLIYVGRLDVSVKGLDILLDAVRLAKDAMIKQKISITIAGTDTKNGRRTINNFVKENNLRKVIKLEGPIFGDEKQKRILEHDMFIQLSRTEAQCLALMEAMDIGMPSIVTPGTTFYEVAREHGVAIPVKGNSHDVSEAILLSELHKRELKEISLKASDYIRKNYSWPVVASKMIDEYNKLLRGL